MPQAADEAEKLKREIIAIGLITAAALVLVSLIYGARGGHSQGAGYLPGLIASALMLSFGIGGYAVPMVLFVMGACYAVERPNLATPRVLLGFSVLFADEAEIVIGSEEHDSIEWLYNWLNHWTWDSNDTIRFEHQKHGSHIWDKQDDDTWGKRISDE